MSTTPTPEQHAWLRKNKGYARTSHAGIAAKFTSRGTLHSDGTFVPESGRTPVLDGNGSFGVGVVIAKRRR